MTGWEVIFVEEQKRYTVGKYTFEDEEIAGRASKEEELIVAMREKYDLNDIKMVYAIYKKGIEEEAFTTQIGYDFMSELRDKLVKSGIVSEDKLGTIFVTGVTKVPQVTLNNVIGEDPAAKFKKLYDGQKLLNKKLKIAIIILAVIMIAFVIIDIKTEYSVFTFFTNYKANMEEELVNKYEKWEDELEQRENALNNPGTVAEPETADTANGGNASE